MSRKIEGEPESKPDETAHFLMQRIEGKVFASASAIIGAEIEGILKDEDFASLSARDITEAVKRGIRELVIHYGTGYEEKIEAYRQYLEK